MSDEATAPGNPSWSIRLPPEIARRIMAYLDAAKGARPTANRGDIIAEMLVECIKARDLAERERTQADGLGAALDAAGLGRVTR